MVSTGADYVDCLHLPREDCLFIVGFTSVSPLLHSKEVSSSYSSSTSNKSSSVGAVTVTPSSAGDGASHTTLGMTVGVGENVFRRLCVVFLAGESHCILGCINEYIGMSQSWVEYIAWKHQ